MLKRLNPEGVPKPGSPYSQAIEAGPGMRWLHISGQVGVDPSGKVLEGAEAQIEQIWRNVLGCLKAAGMGPQDLVKVTVLLTRREDIAVSRDIRRRMLDGAEPASTLMIVSGLASPDLLAEIEAIAAAP
ncbi:MAG: RidA family protein [Alphaproteobacteria bacterium]